MINTYDPTWWFESPLRIENSKTHSVKSFRILVCGHEACFTAEEERKGLTLLLLRLLLLLIILLILLDVDALKVKRSVIFFFFSFFIDWRSGGTFLS